MPFKEIPSFNCMLTAVGLFICAVAITMGAVLLAIEAVPGLHDYNKEKEYHLETTCTLRYTNITGTRDCTFQVTESCHNDYGCDHRTQSMDLTSVWRFRLLLRILMVQY